MSLLRRLVIVGAACATTLALPGVASATGPVANADTYQVVAGDSLYGIAHRHGISVGSLMAANDLGLTSVILPGQRLHLPADATTPSTPSPTTNTTTNTTSRPTPMKAPTSASGNARIDAVVDYARAQVGKPYAFFTRGPDTFDCSGLTVAAYSQVGISLVHSGAPSPPTWWANVRIIDGPQDRAGVFPLGVRDQRPYLPEGWWS